MITKLICTSAVIVGMTALSQTSFAAQEPASRINTSTVTAQDSVEAKPKAALSAKTSVAPKSTDANLTRELRAEIKHQRIAAKNVSLTTEHGMAILRGNVANARAKNKVVGLAQNLAPNVRSDLRVKK